MELPYGESQRGEKRRERERGKGGERRRERGGEGLEKREDE